MPSVLIEHIAKKLKSHNHAVLLLENNDGFLHREDLRDAFADQGIVIIEGTTINRRVHYELRDQSKTLVLLSDDNTDYLDDMKQDSFATELFLDSFIHGYHIPSIVDQEIELLDRLLEQPRLLALTKKQTIRALERIKLSHETETSPFDFVNFKHQLAELVSTPKAEGTEIDWKQVSQLIAKGILGSIGSPQFEHVFSQINEINVLFQEKLAMDFKASKNASAVLRPRIVSKILEYINFNFKDDKVALIVVDGLSYWQYVLLSEKLPGVLQEEVIYSWIPSITQLSRQAIFLGDSPNQAYQQGPVNEEKLWKKYWVNNGCQTFEIRYNHETINLENLERIKRFALVYKDLDDYMHSSKDYKDLLKLTENWIERSRIISVVETLLSQNFNVIITTDHGNIQAKGWRGLTGNEKLGTNKSGSRSERHLEYSEEWLSDEFIKNNPDLKNSIVTEEQAIYFKDDKSFSRKESLVTHGGAHILEVLIPFIAITNE